MAENDCDTLYELLFGTSPAVEDFRPALVANCVFNSFLSYTTVILNIVTIHAIRKTALLPKPLRTLLLSLAASDVGVGLLVQPLYISTLVSRLNKKRIDCISYKGSSAAINFFCISSLFNVVAISVDRFLAVRLHLRYQELVTHKRVIAAVISIWLFSALTSSDLFWAPLVITAVIRLVIMTVCFILVVIVYWRIYIVLKRHKIQIEGLQIQEVQQGVQNGDLSNFLKLRKSALGTFYVCIVFMICYLPSYILYFFPLARPKSRISLYEAWLYATTLLFLNSSLNPVIYCWKMGPIRRTLMDIMRGIVNRFRE
ncbi:melanocyte-stimulating hormone receptor-like [Pocillopora damicornis]|uniref:melanocyte-stimulating hormone receptor-like n=1 Tax=Pocillopora damicornis TaxID=46731 RepID=UPI000F554B72|nr:melanocyte-stimulating hormone receptor-like [Pocillopora damicornis]